MNYSFSDFSYLANLATITTIAILANLAEIKKAGFNPAFSVQKGFRLFANYFLRCLNFTITINGFFYYETGFRFRNHHT